ncbi:Acriflavin resistance protein, partial [hydrothermal vent metagenome]
MQVLGISGRIAKAFLRSKLTPLIVITALLLGVFAIIVTPREEEPQIVVPMVDVFVTYPGAPAGEVEERVTRPMEKLLYEIDGVEYVYSISRPGMSLVIVRFYVGEDMEDSLVKLYNKLMSNSDRIPPGVSPPLVKPRSIDDVPVLALTLWSDRYSGSELRRLAQELDDEIKKDQDVSETRIIGGLKRQVRIAVDPEKLNAYNVSPIGIIQALKQANVLIPSGAFRKNNEEYVVETGAFLESADDVRKVVIGLNGKRPVYLGDVARITDGTEEPDKYVFMGLGPGFSTLKGAGETKITSPAGIYEAVTLSVAKKKGTNASLVTERTLEKIDKLKGTLIPSDIEVTVTRNYGETAKEKSNSLLEHMLIATISVVILIALMLGWREALVVAVAVPVTLALTLLINYLYGYTLNRVTLFALIFSIGILVDDAIVVVENIHRHFKIHGISPLRATLAVDEVGNPTILATFAVIAALLPMAFVSGLMGPYMRPIPVGASAAMIFSLLIAFIVSPWMSYKVLKGVKRTGGKEEGGGLQRVYSKVLNPLLDRTWARLLTLGSVALLLGLALLLIPLKKVTMKMLPFDNKSELQVVIDMPEGTTIEETLKVTREMGEYLRTVPEVADFQLYAGTSAPVNFNGLVRHYFLRRGSNVADIQVNLVSKGQRSDQSHDIAKRLRGPLNDIAVPYGANIKIAEIPPGPPVLSTLVAEVYGPDPKGQVEIARQIKGIFQTTPDVVDVDWYVESPQKKYTFEVDRVKAALSGVSTEAIAQTLRMGLGGASAGLLHLKDEKSPVELMLRIPEEQRSGTRELMDLTVPSANRKLVPVSELVSLKKGTIDTTIYHKNLRRVVYVTGDVAGKQESPVYAIMKMKERIRELKIPEGYELRQYFSEQPGLQNTYSMKWDGEWQITYEVFRDLGIAFGAVLVLIYILVVAWFRNFITPLIIMAPIPLTLVGILPGHWAFSAFFTATSMIGFIALAGIIVRNSILLIDFVEMEWKNGIPLKEALIRAGAVRFRPIALTAAAVVVGSFVMLFDPIFQGLAIAMMFGATASTALTLVVV